MEEKIDRLIEILNEATKMLIEARIIISELGKDVPYLNSVYKTDIQSLGLSVRAMTVLRNMGVKKVGDLALCTKIKLSRQRDCGRATLDEIERVLKNIGVELKK